MQKAQSDVRIRLNEPDDDEIDDEEFEEDMAEQFFFQYCEHYYSISRGCNLLWMSVSQ